MMPATTENAAPDGPRSGDILPHACVVLNGRESSYHKDSLSESPLDREIAVTQFRDARATRAFRHLVPLRDLAPKIETRRAERKDCLPWLKLATFGDNPSRKGSLRHNANVVTIDGIEGDHDAGTLTPAQAAQRLQQAGVAAIIYTSPSHTPERPRWRVLTPLSRSMPPEDRERLCARLQGVLGGALARESFALSQGYYYGGVEGGAAPETLLIDGAGIDTLDGLDAGALDKAGKPYARIDPDDFMYVPPALLDPPQDNDDDPFSGVDLVNRVKIAAALAAIPADARDDREGCWRPVGMALHHEFGGSDEGLALWNEWSAVSPEFEKKRPQRVDWESFGGRSSGATSIATLYAMADQHDRTWRKKAKAVAPREPSRLQLFSPGDCANAPPRGYIIKRMIAPRDVVCIFGAPGAGKSTIAPYLGYRLARGEEAFGQRTKKGKVLYVAAEDTHGMKNRVAALRRRLGDAPGFYVVDGVTDLLGDGEDDAPDLAALREHVEAIQPAMIVIDTLAIAFPNLEENDSQSMQRVNDIARSLTTDGAAVVIVHHGTKAEGSTPRGHSRFNGALDITLQLLPPDSAGIIRGTFRKNRNGPQDLDIAFRVESEEMGRDEDGDAITAAIVGELPAGTVPRGPSLPVGQREALAMLYKLEATGQPVTEDGWRDACIESRRVSQSDERDSRKKAFNRARSGLFRAGLILLCDDRVTVARQPAAILSSFDDMEDGE